MKVAQTIILPVLLSLYGVTLRAQTFTKCGTVVTPEQVAAERSLPSFNDEKSMFVPNRCFGKTLSITAHIISDSLGNYGSTPANLPGAIANLNNLFAPICISFEVCSVNYIPNYKYNRFLRVTEEQELINLYLVENTINMFFAQVVEVSPGNMVGGYAYLPGGPDFIAISKTSMTSIPHEMGHFFGLYHTFEDQFGIELANGSNCATTGDLVCDTPGDPGGVNYPAPNCNHNPGAQDPTGEWYVPQVGNIMSYYSDDCQCGFTTQQYNRMTNRYQAARFYLW